MRYKNPLWSGYFADPYILRHENCYYAFGTGASPLESDGRAFPLLRSKDLLHWDYLGGALQPLEGASAYWAPEVAEESGQFYLYYSAALGPSDAFHRVRVAHAPSPAGPFVDSGKVLFQEHAFTIDPHPFQDPKTGKWYLFFASDYTAAEPFGTGVGVVSLKDMQTVESPPAIVNRATQDWQIYERDRSYQDRVWKAWYTVEGPSVLFHDDRYWCFYSAGRWSGDNYGVGFAVAPHPLGPWRDDFAIHGPVVLKGTDKVIGPGHNSFITAPDGQSQMMIYHAWDTSHTARRLCMDPLTWTPEGPRCDGPTTDSEVILPFHKIVAVPPA